VVPALAFMLLISAFPLVHSIVVSFQKITMMAVDTSFAGVANYQRVFTDGRFWAALGRTLLMAAIALPIQIVLGLALAQLFVDEMRAKRWLVAVLILPAILSPIVAGASWKLMFDGRYGPINQVIGWFAGHEVTLLWTVDPVLVYPAIIIVEVWQHTPFVFLLLLAALSNVDRSLLEAAEIDGAGFWMTFRKVVLPAIRPVLAVVIVIRGLDLMRLFEIIWALTRGGPGTMTETISIYIYRKGFEQFDTSFTAAMAAILILVLAVLVGFGLRLVRTSL
jgi:multiple sugar transport system permease protein